MIVLELFCLSCVLLFVCCCAGHELSVVFLFVLPMTTYSLLQTIMMMSSASVQKKVTLKFKSFQKNVFGPILRKITIKARSSYLFMKLIRVRKQNETSTKNIPTRQQHESRSRSFLTNGIQISLRFKFQGVIQASRRQAAKKEPITQASTKYNQILAGH